VIPDVQNLGDNVGETTGMIFSAVKLLRTAATDAVREWLQRSKMFKTWAMILGR
jgi:hypothetical protein